MHTCIILKLEEFALESGNTTNSIMSIKPTGSEIQWVLQRKNEGGQKEGI